MTRTTLGRRAATLSIAVATAALTVGLGTSTASANETPTPEPTPTASIEPTPTASPSPSTAPAPKPAEAPKPADAPKTEPPADADETGSIKGRVWNDVNRNGIQDKGEEGVADVFIAGIEVNPGAQPPLARAGRLADGANLDETALTIRTDDHGNYSLTDVRPGNVLLYVGGDGTVDGDRQYLRFSPTDVGDDDALDSDVQEVAYEQPDRPPLHGARIDRLPVGAGEEVDVDAGAYVDPAHEGEQFASVRGRVWDDKNGNGIQDAGEPGIAWVPLAIIGDDVEEAKLPAVRSKIAAKAEAGASKRGAQADDEFESTVTNLDGSYYFENVPPGNYHVEVIAATIGGGKLNGGWSVTKYHQGTDLTKNSDFKPTTFTDGSGQTLAGGFTVMLGLLPGRKIDLDAGLVKDTPTPAPGGGGSLPNTGLAVGGFLLVGTLLVGGGTVLTVAARRRRKITA
jgi:hypothetical protein